MIPRCASYCRVSSDKQSSTSLADQSRLCDERAAREGWEMVARYEDQSMSGASANRPGLQAMLRDASQGLWDFLVVEATDRVSRSARDTIDVYDKLAYYGITIYSVAAGEVTPIHIGVDGIVNSQFLRSLAQKTHRGLKSKVLAGKNVAKKTYGYDIVKRFDENGQAVRGEIRINDVEAAVIKRIYRDFAIKRLSPRKIAIQLNAEGVLGPTGGTWSASSILGSRHKGNGVLNQSRYAGQIAWNRTAWRKHPDTGRRVPRLNDPSEITYVDAPQLRIVPQELIDHVRQVQGEIAARPLQQQKRPPKLLSYLLQCHCGSGMSLISADRYGCSAARNRGTCGNRLTVKQSVLEDAVIGTLSTRLMLPELTAIFCEEYITFANRLRMDSNAMMDGYRAELVRVESRLGRIVSAIGDGGASVKLLMMEALKLEARQGELQALLATKREAPTLIHPKMSLHYQIEVQRLVAALHDERDRDEAVDRLRKLIDKIILTPTGDGRMTVDLRGDLAGILLMSVGRTPAYKPTQSSGLNIVQTAEIEQAKMIVSAAGNWLGLAAQQVELVAGTGFDRCRTRFRLTAVRSTHSC